MTECAKCSRDLRPTLIIVVGMCHNCAEQELSRLRGIEGALLLPYQNREDPRAAAIEAYRSTWQECGGSDAIADALEVK